MLFRSGDTWRICLAFAGIKTRPKEFATKPGTGFALETLKRGDVLPEPEPADETDAGLPTELEGEWSMVSGSADGYPMHASMVKSGRRIAKGNRLTVLFGSEVFMKARIKLDPSKSPKEIDYAIAAGASAGSAQLGIYQLDGELAKRTLKLCMAPTGQPRPTDFSTVKGDGRILTGWKPAKPSSK